MYKIYLITNLINNKKYVGITKKTLESRWQSHIDTTRKKKKYAIHFAIEKYGSENFEVSLLEETNDTSRETFWIEKLGTFTEGYNLTKGGDGIFGVVFSDTERQNRSDLAKQNHKNKTIGMYGKQHSEEAKQKIKQKHIELNRTGTNNPMFGRKHSEEALLKMRRPKSEETKLRMKEAAKRRKQI